MVFVSTIVLIIVLTNNLFFGDFEINPLEISRWCAMITFILFFVMVSFVADLILSLKSIKNYTNHNVWNVWKEVFTNPLKGIIIISVMYFGLTEIQSLVEYYRVNSTVYYDYVLWEIESNIFAHLKGSFIDIPIFWEKIYFNFFSYNIIGFAILNRSKKLHSVKVMAGAFLFSFLMARIVAIQFPTAGPAFYMPDLFEVTPHLTQEARNLLLKYMDGLQAQNGLIPATMAMPSLHISITIIISWFLFHNFKWTGWISSVWIILTWLSTVFLGWHYVLDGAVAIIVAVFSIVISDSLAKLEKRIRLNEQYEK